MPIDIDVQSFAELNNNVTDINNKVTPIQNMALNDVPAGSNNKISVRRSPVWSIEGEEAYNGQFQELGNISGDVVLELNTTTSRTAIIATITDHTFVTSFGADMLTSHVYTIFLKQNSTGNHSVRWPYGASVLNMVGPDPNQITAVYVVKLPNGKIFVKCEAFQNTVEIGSVIKEFQPPTITYPDEGNAPIGFTWSKMPELAYGGTLSDLYSDWEIARDELYTVLLFSSYNNIVDLYSIDVVLSASGTAYMRTRYGGNIDGEAVVGPWEEAVVEISGVPPLWTPQFIETALWLDAADESTLTLDVSSVSEWRDKSGNERHTTSPLSLKPTHTSSGINGMGSIVFSSGVDPMIVPSFASPTGAEGLLVAFVAEKTGEPVNYSNPLTFGAVNAQWSFVLPKAGVGAANGESDCWFRNRSVDESHVLSVNNFGVNVPRMVVGTLKDSDGMTLLFDGSVEATRAPAVHVLGSAAALTIGSSPDSSYSGNRFQGRIGEIVAIYGDTSLVTLQKIEGYLAHKWSLSANLPDDHPYKYAPPRKFTPDTWTPAEITTALWLDAADAENVLLNESGKVSTWLDKSGSARNYTTSTPALNYSANKYVTFDNVNILSFPSTLSDFSLAGFVFFVVRATQILNTCSNSNSGTCMGSPAPGCITNAGQPGVGEALGTNRVVSYHHRPGTICAPTNIVSPNTGFYSVLFVYSSNVCTVYINGVSMGSGVAFSQSHKTLNLGSGPYGKFAGDVCEHIIGTYVPSASDIAYLFGYASHKWDALLGVTTLVDALPSDHPYKTAAPLQGANYVTDNTTLISGNLLEGTTGLTISQVNSDPLNVGIDVAGSNGGLFRIYANGSWTFDPNSEFGALFYPETSDTSVTYHVSDGVSEAMATWMITVTAVAPEQDPLWDNVVLCLNAAGADNSTTIIDETGKTPSIVNGDTKISTVLGYNSIYLDGSGDYVRFGADGTDFDFGSDSFCLEAWLYLNTIAGNLFTQRTASNTAGISFGFHNNQVSMTLGNGSSWFYAPSNFNLGVGANTLFHIALIRDGNTIRVCRDGTQIHSGTTTGVVGPVGLPVNIGWDPGNSGMSYYPLSGHIKGFRITKGVPRYTGTSFTPDSAPFLT